MLIQTPYRLYFWQIYSIEDLLDVDHFIKNGITQIIETINPSSSTEEKLRELLNKLPATYSMEVHKGQCKEYYSINLYSTGKIDPDGKLICASYDFNIGNESVNPIRNA